MAPVLSLPIGSRLSKWLAKIQKFVRPGEPTVPLQRSAQSSDEQARLEALHQYGILDSDPEHQFDELTALASSICATPVASIGLVDEHRVWFKSKRGMTMSEAPREVAFCSHAILQPNLFVVEDALTDPRFAKNPLVQDDPKFRFYAGMPLHTSSGHAIGTLC